MLGDHLTKLRKAHNWTQQEVSDKLRISRGTYAHYEINKRQPDYETLLRLAAIFEVSTDELLGHSVIKNERVMHRSLSDTSIKHSIIPDSEMVQVPVLGSIRAGQPMEMIREMAPEYTFVEKAVVGTHEAFVLIVNGESLSGDNIHDGDRVVVIIGIDWTASDICVVAINGDEATLKRVKQQGDICILLPSNPDMEPMVYPAKDVHVIGVVVEHRRKMR